MGGGTSNPSANWSTDPLDIPDYCPAQIKSRILKALSLSNHPSIRESLNYIIKTAIPLLNSDITPFTLYDKGVCAMGSLSVYFGDARKKVTVEDSEELVPSWCNKSMFRNCHGNTKLLDAMTQARRQIEQLEVQIADLLLRRYIDLPHIRYSPNHGSCLRKYLTSMILLVDSNHSDRITLWSSALRRHIESTNG